ncbi:MAG: VOC family protein [Pseudomonadota bacterium]
MSRPRLSLVLACAALLPLPCAAEAAGERRAAAPARTITMQVESAYPVIVTDKLRASRDFYVRWLGFDVVFEASWFVYLAAGSAGIAFMTPDHPSQPPGPEQFNGKGMFLTLQVADAAAAFGQAQQAGAPIAYALRDEPWGQRRFALVDPNGMWVDVVQQTEPAAGYWERYVPQ